MRIPIKALKELSKKYWLTHVIVFGVDEDGVTQQIATYGRTVEQCSQAADAGNRLKEFLGWPKSLHAQPCRVVKLQKELERIKAKINRIKREHPLAEDILRILETK